MTPLFSIVVPIYNCEKYIRQCIESVVSQSYSDWELILVDDGSTDGSRFICDEYANKYPGIKILTQINQGPGIARNTGIKHAHGEYMLFLDADDFFAEKSFSNIAAAIKENNNPDIILARAKNYHENSSTVSQFTPRYDIGKIINKTACEVVLYLFEPPIESFWSAWNHIFKRDLIVNNNIYFRKTFGEDLDWTPQVILRAKEFAVLQEPFYNYRVVSGMSLSKSIAWELGMYNVVVEWLTRIEQLDVKSEQKKQLASNFVNIYYCNLWRLWNHPHKERHQIVKFLNEYKYIWKMGGAKKCRLLGFLCRTIGPAMTAFLLNIRQRAKIFCSPAP